MLSNRDHGKIVFWSTDRGYCFIRPDGGDRDVFVHFRDCELPQGEMPQHGDRVTYEIGTDRTGKQCARLVRLEGQEAPQHAGTFKMPGEVVSGEALADWLTREQK